MAVKRLLQLRPQYDDGNGALASGYRLFFYAAKSSTKQNTYNSSTGLNANTNPIVLNALGEPAVEIWGTVGQTYKVGLAIPGSDDPPASFIWNEDDISPINDTTVTQDEWAAGPTPTYVSATQFTLTGDQTTTFAVDRRLKFTVTAGTVYGRITASVFGALTTVTVVCEPAQALDSGLSAVSYALLNPTHPSIPWVGVAADTVSTIASAATVNLDANAKDYAFISGVVTVTAITLGQSKACTVEFQGALTLTNGASLILPGGASIVTAAGDTAIFRGEAAGVVRCITYTRASGLPIIDPAPISTGRNIAARTNSGTPNTKLDITADEVILRDSSGNAFRAATVSGTIDFGTVGANGIDAATQAVSTWYYGYVIAKPDGTVAVLGSASATAPTMPSGYTFKALVTAARSDGSTHFLPYRQFGNRCYYETQQNALSNGTATVETAVSLTTLVPPSATEILLNTQQDALCDGSGNFNDVVTIKFISGAVYWSQQNVHSAESPNAAIFCGTSQLSIPNVSQQIYYFHTTSAGATFHFSIWVCGFTLPGGGE